MDRPIGFKGEYVVFDIETTGFSPYSDRITEISALLVRDMAIVPDASFSTLVNPQKPIPGVVSDITGITDKMVANAPLEREAVASFLDFAQDRVLVAHNARFDMGFINAASKRNGFKSNLACLDTLALSRLLLPGLENHKLDTLARRLNFVAFNHHRAEADAETLSSLFVYLLNKLESVYDICDFQSLIEMYPSVMI